MDFFCAVTLVWCSLRVFPGAHTYIFTVTASWVVWVTFSHGPYAKQGYVGTIVQDGKGGTTKSLRGFVDQIEVRLAPGSVKLYSGVQMICS